MAKRNDGKTEGAAPVPMDGDRHGKTARWWFPAAVVLCWLVIGLWITGQSFWLDEGMAISKSVQPTFREFWRSFSATHNSDLQQPLFMLLSWTWEKIVGHSEWNMRSLNLAWMALAIGYVASRPWWNRRVRLLWCVLAALSPFLAMYMDEAKGYILHFAGGALLFLSVAGAGGKPVEGFDFRAFSLGLLLTCGSALTGVVYAFWPCLWLLVRLIRERAWKRFLSRHAGWLAVDAACLALLGGWYLHTLLIGARGTNLGPPTPATMAFLAYEWFGFSGLGPSRLVMRLEKAAAVRPFVLPLALYAAALAFFAFECWRVWRNRPRSAPPVSAPSTWPRASSWALPMLLGAVGLLSMVVVGLVDDMAVRARHVMPVFPAALLVVAVWADRMLADGRKAPRAALAILLVAMAASSLAFRFGPRHGKENYRHAASLAKEAVAAGQRVWWTADACTASIYGLFNGKTDACIHCNSLRPEDFAPPLLPDVVFLCRPDTWDPQGRVVHFLKTHDYRETDSFTGFRVYRLVPNMP